MPCRETRLYLLILNVRKVGYHNHPNLTISPFFGIVGRKGGIRVYTECEKCGKELASEYAEEWRFCEECRVGMGTYSEEDGSENVPRKKRKHSSTSAQDNYMLELKKQTAILNTVKKCIVFFVVLTVINLIIWFVIGVRMSVFVNAISNVRF